MRLALLPLVGLLLLFGCASTPVGEQVKDEPLAEYKLRGEIISLDAQTSVVKIKHEDIVGYMGAMTMEFPVKDAAEFAKLKVGTYMEAKLFVRGLDFWVGSFTEVPAPAPQDTPTAAK